MLLGLGELLRNRYGVVLEDVISEVGVDAAALTPDPVVSMPLNDYSHLLEVAARRAGEPCLGLRLAHAFPRGGAGALGYLILNSPDSRTALECLCRYVRLQSEGGRFDLVEEDGVTTLGIDFGALFVAPRKQLLEFIMALIVLRLGVEFGGAVQPIGAEFEYRNPGCTAEYTKLFGPRLVFDQPRNTIKLRTNSLAARSSRADTQLFGVLKSIADAEIERLSQTESVVAEVGEYVLRNLALRTATLEGAAAATGRSSRQLQTELKRSGTTFDEQLSQLRRTLAQRYLRDSDLSLSEIALMLGFSELSAFTRAARAWQGMPPSQWRQELRAAAGR